MTYQRPDPRRGTWSTSPVPTVLRCERPGGGPTTAYRVYDPDLLAGRNITLAANGRTTSPHDVLQGFGIMLLLGGSAVAAPVLFSPGGFWSAVLWVAAGLGAGLGVLFLLYLVFVRDPFEAYRKRHGSTASPFLEVDRDSRAGVLCAMAESIASTPAWRDGAIDPDRLVPGTLWSAVRLATRLANRAHRPDEGGKSDLDHVERNLSEIDRIAHEIDTGSHGSGGTPAGSGRRGSNPAVAGSDAILAQSQALRDLL